MGIIGIKAAKPDFVATIAKTVRKYRDISISEIKALVLAGNVLQIRIFGCKTTCNRTLPRPRGAQ